MPSPLEQLAATLTEPFVVIGGHALQAYGHLRTTLDTDILIASETADSLALELGSLGFLPSASNQLVLRFSRATAPGDYEESLDVLIVDTGTFDQIHATARQLDLGSATCLVPSLHHLLALKFHAIRQDPRREWRDLADIEALVRLNSADISVDEIRQIAAKHGPEGMLQKLSRILDQPET